MSKLSSVQRAMELKGREKDEREQQFREAQLKHNEILDELDLVDKGIVDAVARLEIVQKQHEINPEELGILYEYCAQMDVKRGLKKQALSESQQVLSAKQDMLVESHKEMKALEVFRDKLLSFLSKQADKVEQKQTDELFVSRRKQQV